MHGPTSGIVHIERFILNLHQLNEIYQSKTRLLIHKCNSYAMQFKYVEWDERFAKKNNHTPFEILNDLFQELLTVASGDVRKALEWLNTIDDEYDITGQF